MMKTSGKKRVRLWVIVLSLLVAVALIIPATAVWAAFGVIGKEYLPETVIPSPDGKYELIVCEWETFYGGGSEVYLRESGHDKWYNSWIRTKIGTTSAEYGIRPFSNGYYYVEWENEQVIVHYYRGVEAEDPDDSTTWLRSFSAEY